MGPCAVAQPRACWRRQSPRCVSAPTCRGASRERSLDAQFSLVPLQVLAGADRLDALVVDNAGTDEPMLVAEALADLSDGGLRVDTLVTVLGVSSFLAEWAAADLLVERGMEQDEDDPRTVTELLASQVRPPSC